MPIAYFSDERKGDMITKLTVDVQEVEHSIMSVLEVTFREPITVLLYLGAMLMISPKLTLFVLIVLPISGLIIGRVGRTLKQQSHQAQTRLGLLMTIIDETLSGLRIIKGFNAEKQQTQRFAANNEQHYKVMRSMLRRRDLSAPLSEFLSITIVALVLYVGGRMVLNNNSSLEAETFILFMVIFSQILPPAKSFATAFYTIQKGLASVERIDAILQAPITIKDPEKTILLNKFEQHISFKEVGFAYDKKAVLQNINITLAKGKSLAIVGASGAGKSTLVDLIPRFYEVSTGSICLDGVDIKQFKRSDLRSLMGIVTQQPILFNDTIYNNLTLGINRTISLDEVIAAAKIANAHDFINQLPNTYQTNIGDAGSKLSGGERQRLTIARAVLKNPPLLILDEATSSLDSASEKLVQDALFKLMQNRTAIIIAHRLSTIQFADEIIVLQQGNIVERGTHDELLEQHGAYKKMVDLQLFQ